MPLAEQLTVADMESVTSKKHPEKEKGRAEEALFYKLKDCEDNATCLIQQRVKNSISCSNRNSTPLPLSPITLLKFNPINR